MKKKKVLIIVLIALILTVIIGTSYAYWLMTFTQNGVNLVSSECFELTFTQESDDISIIDAYPMTDNAGSKLTPFTFKVKNICNYNADFNIDLETLNSSTMGVDYIRVKVNEMDSFVLGTKESTNQIANTNVSDSRILYSSSLIPNQEKTYNIRLWIDYDSTAEQSADKEYKGKIAVVATLNKSTHVVALNANGGYVEENKILKNVGETIGEIPTPSREHFVFKGWYSDEELTNEVSEDTQITDSLNNIYAKWEDVTYSVTFVLNNVSVSEEELTFIYGQSHEITVTPSEGYSIYSASCTNDYSINILTGIDQTSAQNVTISNNNNKNGSVCSITAYRMVNFVTYLKSLEDSETIVQDDLTDDHNMRYTGTAPANYVNFRLSDGSYENWRVIGVFNSNTHGTEETNRAKIVRAETIGNVAFHGNSSSTSNWNISSLMKSINSNNQKFVGSELIDDAAWKLGGNSIDSVLASSIYSYERNNPVHDTWTGKVALPYASDFAYSIANGENRTTCLEKEMQNWNTTGYNNVCLTSSWMYLNNKNIWTLTPYNVSAIHIVYSNQRISYTYVYDYQTNYAYPAAYLKSNVLCINCNTENVGTIDNPFELVVE